MTTKEKASRIIIEKEWFKALYNVHSDPIERAKLILARLNKTILAKAASR